MSRPARLARPVALLAVVAALTSVAQARGLRRFTATGYAVAGRTASGSRARAGIVAADPKVLPLGSRIRIAEAGRYSGDYVVEDTGGSIRGRRIDIYFANDAEARRFGRRSVQVEVLDRTRGEDR